MADWRQMKTNDRASAMTCCSALRRGLLLAFLLAGAPPAAFGQIQNGSVFNSQGPGPAIGSRDLIDSGDDPPKGTTTGAIEAIAVNPSNPNTIFAGAVNGG